MPLFRRVLRTGGNSIVVATPAITGSTQVMFRVTTEDGRSCCCPTIELGCDELVYPEAGTVYDDPYFSADTSITQASPPWSAILNAALTTPTATGLEVYDEVVNADGAIRHTRYSRWSGTPAVQLTSIIDLTYPTFSYTISLLAYASSAGVLVPWKGISITVSISPDDLGNEYVVWNVREVQTGSDLAFGSFISTPAYTIGTANYHTITLSVLMDNVTLGPVLNSVDVTASINDVLRYTGTESSSLLPSECVFRSQWSLLAFLFEDPDPIALLMNQFSFDVT